jgi:hypothetical protein
MQRPADATDAAGSERLPTAVGAQRQVPGAIQPAHSIAGHLQPVWSATLQPTHLTSTAWLGTGTTRQLLTL